MIQQQLSQQFLASCGNQHFQRNKRNTAVARPLYAYYGENGLFGLQLFNHLVKLPDFCRNNRNFLFRQVVNDFLDEFLYLNRGAFA
ncbi:hypothetical protein D3C86_2013550 [compost metagenome]